MPDTPNATGTVQPIYRPGSTGGLDFPIRGGQLEFNLGTQSFTVSSRIDRSRIRKFFEDKPRGTAFIQKQVGLQLSNPKIETGNTLFGIPQGLPYPGLLENTRVYNLGANTLAQVGVSGTGFHANRAGLVPFNLFEKFYYSIVNAQNVNNQKASNRLINLMALKMTTGDPFANPANIPDINLVNTLGISLNRNMIYQYLGGPGSVYGVGTTTIPRVVDTTKLTSRSVMTYDNLMLQSSNKGNIKAELQDFRAQVQDTFQQSQAWNYEVSTDYRFFVNKKDRLNLTYPFLFQNNTAPWEINKAETQDLIKFVFEAISNDNPTISTAIFFRAFLTAGITDTNNAELNSFKYIGRGENFFTYQGFTRTVGFSFRVAAQSKEELRPLYNKLNLLLGQVYPDYSPNQGIMRAPLIRVTIGDYLYRVPGFIESINLTVDNNTPWEINLDGSTDLAQLPQVVDVAVTFRPILDVLPKRPSTMSSISTTVNEQTITATDTESITSNVSPLIANVPKSSPEDTNTFIKPNLIPLEVSSTTRRANPFELPPLPSTPVRNVNVTPNTNLSIPSIPTQINRR
jgi:hypothetical protein